MPRIKGRQTKDMSITFRPDLDLVSQLKQMRQVGVNLSFLANEALRKHILSIKEPQQIIKELCAERIRAAKHMSAITSQIKELEEKYGISEEETTETHQEALVRVQKETLFKIPEKVQS